MPGAEIANVRGVWEGGNLHIQDANYVDVAVIGIPTTGVRFMPAGTVEVVTTSATLDGSDIGKILYCLATTTITLTLPSAVSTCCHANYHILNGGSSGSVEIVVLAGVTSDTFIGSGEATTDVVYQLTNTGSTSVTGDAIHLLANGSTSGNWLITGLTGTWVSTT